MQEIWDALAKRGHEEYGGELVTQRNSYEKDLGDLTSQLVKLTVETALSAELDEHLGYEKHDPAGRGTGNSRNGSYSKRIKGDHGEVDVDMPRDRDASFHGRAPS